MGTSIWIAAVAAMAAHEPASAPRLPGELVGCDEAGLGIWSVSVDERRGVRSFYRGAVTLLELDMVEPAGAPAGVAIVMPAVPIENEPVGPTCWAVVGYSSVDVAAARASYDPRQGLTLSIPTYVYDGESDRAVAGAPIRLRINPTRGTIVNLDARSR